MLVKRKVARKNPFRKPSEKKLIKSQFRNFILEQNHPCMMAQSVFSQDQVDLHVYEDFGSKQTAAVILKDLEAYLKNYNFESNSFFTFIAVFKNEKIDSEIDFEQKLWKQLSMLHQLDTIPWDREVSTDPQSKDFSFSLLGRAFYIVGLHPDSSRMARQSPYPAMVFNLHWQFEKLREMGSYETVRDKIRERDIKLQGSINPMMEDFGENSEARQYSGRKVGEEWKCPFLHSKV